MKKNKLKYLFICTIISSCTNNSPISKQPETILNPTNNTDSILKNANDSKINKISSLSVENSAQGNDLVTKPSENIDPLVAKPSENIDPLVAKPSENIDPLVTKPSENVDPLVTKPGENIDPEKITSVITKQGFVDITFSQGTNQVNLNVSLSEFKILAINESELVETIDILLKMNKESNKTVSINKDVFASQSNLVISIKGLRDLDNLTIELIGKNKDSKIISNKEVMNESLKGNKSINSTFYKGSTNNTPTTSTTPNTPTTSTTPNTPTTSTTPNTPTTSTTPNTSDKNNENKPK